MRSIGIPRSLFGGAVAVALVASACSAEPATEVQASAESSSTASADAGAGSEVGEESTGQESTGGEPESSEQPADSSEETAAPSAHLFPDLNTVNIADGTTVNLAEELAGGDTPVLLWFWAPH